MTVSFSGLLTSAFGLSRRYFEEIFTEEKGLVPFSRCDRYVAKLEGESPLWAQVRRTIREGKGVHCEVESEESRIQTTDLTNRKCIKARVSRMRMPWNPKSNTYPEETNVFATD